jgi:hypothetical protein
MTIEMLFFIIVAIVLFFGGIGSAIIHRIHPRNILYRRSLCPANRYLTNFQDTIIDHISEPDYLGAVLHRVPPPIGQVRLWLSPLPVPVARSITNRPLCDDELDQRHGLQNSFQLTANVFRHSHRLI